VVRTGSSDSTGIFTACQPQDDDPPGTPTLSVFSETTAGGIRLSIDKNLIVAPLALIEQKEGGDGHIDVSAGTARFLDAAPPGAKDRLGLCEVEVKSSVVPDSVKVTQGKTSLKGSKLVYDESDGIARIDGPVTFERQSPGNNLTGKSKTIEVNVDDKTTTLVGGVTLQDGTRTSSAERVEYDDAANVAILRGTEGAPATSKAKDQDLRARIIRYNLDTGDAVAIDPVGSSFDDGESGGSTSGAGAPPAGGTGSTPGADTPGTETPATPGKSPPDPGKP
jgi:lipopolysaccharide transport protein LptA